MPTIRALTAIALVVAACGGVASPAPTATPEPTTATTPAPIATAVPIPPGPLRGAGPLIRAMYATPLGFSPAFTFEVAAAGWQAVGQPDAFGFALARPDLGHADAIVGLLVPRSDTVEAFEAELDATGLLDADATRSDLEIGGLPARSFVVNHGQPVEAFVALKANGEVSTAFGGAFGENELVYVAHPERPFVLVLSLGAKASLEDRVMFDRLVESLAFR